MIDEKRMSQLDLFAPPSIDPAIIAGDWWSGFRPDYESQTMAKYIIMIRAVGDLERIPREQSPSSDRGERALFNAKKITDMHIEDLKSQILELLKDGKPRTFNCICVSLWNRTADIFGGERPEEAIWQLAESSHIEYTPVAPVLFRLIHAA